MPLNRDDVSVRASLCGLVALLRRRLADDDLVVRLVWKLRTVPYPWRGLPDRRAFRNLYLWGYEPVSRGPM